MIREGGVSGQSYLSVFPRTRVRPDSAALAAAWNRPGAGYALDMKNWATKQVEKIRTAWYSGAYYWPPWFDNFTDETAEIRDAYLPLLQEPMVKAGHLTKAASVQALDCSVLPADPDDARQRAAATAFKWVLDQIGQGNKGGRTSGPALIADEILRPAMILGWSLCELVGPEVCRWPGPAQGKEYWRDIKSKDTRRLALRLDGYKNVIGVRSFTQAGWIWEGSDLESFVIYAHWPLYCSPAGMSDFRAVYRACWIKNVAMRLRALGLDRWTHPYLKGTAATQEQRTALATSLEDARGNGFVVLAPGDLVEAMSLAVGSDDIFHNAIQDLDREILIGVAWSHLPIQEGQTTGGRGNTSVQQGTAELGQWALAAALGGVVTGQMARPWYERNFADVEPARVVWGAVNEQALLQAAQLDRLLLENGLKLSRHERQQYFGRAAPEDDADTLEAPGKSPGGPGGPGGAGGLAGLLGGGPGGNGAGGASFSEDFADASEGPAAEADREELAGLIADMLYHLFGAKAGQMLTAESMVEKFAAGWSKEDHPRGEGGRFIKKGSPEAVRTAQEVVRKVLKGDPSATPDDLVKHLAILRVDQLRQLHREAGVKRIPKEILRQHLVEAVRDRLTSSKELQGLRDEFRQLKGARPPDTMGATALRKQIELARQGPVPLTKEVPGAAPIEAPAAASPMVARIRRDAADALKETRGRALTETELVSQLGVPTGGGPATDAARQVIAEMVADGRLEPSGMRNQELTYRAATPKPQAAAPAEPAATVPAAVPERIRTRVQGALDDLKEHAAELARARDLDRRFGGGGRYESEVDAKFAGSSAAAHRALDEFRQTAAKKGVDAEAFISEMGGVPETGISTAATAHRAEQAQMRQERAKQGPAPKTKEVPGGAAAAPVAQPLVTRGGAVIHEPGAPTPLVAATVNDVLGRHGGDLGRARAALEDHLKKYPRGSAAGATRAALDEIKRRQQVAPPKLHDDIMARLADLPKSPSGLAKIHELRAAVGATEGSARQAFDDAMHDLRRQGKLRMVSTSGGRSDITRQQLGDSIKGQHETLFYVQPMGGEPAPGQPAAAEVPAPAHQAAPAPKAPGPAAAGGALAAADPHRLGDAVARAGLYTSRLAGRPYIDNEAFHAEIGRAAPGATNAEIKELMDHLDKSRAIELHSINEKHRLTDAERHTYAMHTDPADPTAGKEVFLMRDPAKARQAVADFLAARHG